MPKGRNAVTGRAWNSKAVDVETVRLMVESEGLTHAAVAARVGLSPGYVSTFCKRNGIQSASRGPRRGPGHPNWAGGRVIDKDGYVNLWDPTHPLAKKQGYVLEHRKVAADMLGRNLLPGEVVHHLNGVKDDNRPCNLEVFATNAEHLRAELTGRTYRNAAQRRELLLSQVAKSTATRKAKARRDPQSP